MLEKTRRRYKLQSPNTPFPGIVAPRRRWLVEPTRHDMRTATCSRPQGERIGILTVPLGDSHLEQIIRAHEMGHARWSKNTLKAVRRKIRASYFSLQIAADVLVTYGLNQRGLPVPCTCAICRAEYNDMVEIIQAQLECDAMTAHSITTMKMGITYSDTDHVTIYLDALQDAQDIAYKWASGGMSYLRALKQLAEYIEAYIPKQSGKNWLGLGTRIPPGYWEKAVPGYIPGLAWVKPTLVREGLIASKHAFARSVRASEVGAVPRFMHRLVIDGAVFGHKKRIAGCSVLVDCSGSMGILPDELLQLIAKYPAGIVAGYSVDKLQVLAERGRMITEIPGWDGGNESDGPSLEWLLQQPAPRIWVTDMGVTIKGDSPHPKAPRHCLALCRFGNVTIKQTVAEVLDQGY